MCSSIDKNTYKGSHVGGLDNPNIHYANNRSEDTQFFLPFMPYIVLTQILVDQTTIFCFFKYYFLLFPCFLC